MATYNAPVAEGGVLTMGYTGTIDTVNILKDGLYKLEVWGASGGGGRGEWNNDIYDFNRTSGGRGGYAIFHVFLSKNETIYAALGGLGYLNSRSATFNGGGGSGGDDNTYGGGGSGGGASHFSKIYGTVADIGASRLSQILAIAGGGGGGSNGGNGGYGGGVNGGDGSNPGLGWLGSGATQTGTGRGGQYWGDAGGFGYGGGGGNYAGGAGGGLYGGRGGGQSGGGGGGSGYIQRQTTEFRGTRYSNSMTNGANGGSGQGRITLVKKSVPTIYFNTGQIDAIPHGSIDITDVFYNTTQL